MLDLVTATGPGGHNDGAKRLSSHLLNQRFSHFQRKFICRSQRSKGSRHAATTGFQQSNISFRQAFRELLHETGIQQRLRMAMRVDDYIRRFGVECERVWLVLKQLFNELLEQKRTLRNL